MTIAVTIVVVSMQTRSSSNASSKGASGSAPINEADPNIQRGRKAVDSKSKAVKKSMEKCQWSPDEEERLIMFLVSRKSEAGDGGSFKSPVWTAAAEEMAKISPLKGTKKTPSACSSKYGRVGICMHCAF